MYGQGGWEYMLEQTIFNAFLIIQIFLTVFFLIRLFVLAYKKEEINYRRFKFLVASSIVAGLLLALTLPPGFQKLFNDFF
jgi:hypothetical protein